MTLHDSCHSNVGWTVPKTTEELVSDGDLTSSDFDLDLGSFANIRNSDDGHNETSWKTYADLTEQQSCGTKDLNNNSCGKSLMLSSSSYHASSCDEQNVKLREIGHISPLHCGTFDRNSQGHAHSGSAVSEVLVRQDMTSPHLVTSNSEWMNLVASMNLTQLYDGTSTPSFQYILGAATTPATKMNEESLTYLNQGQSYEIKLKRLNDGPGVSDTEQYLKSVIRVVFHERRLQYMEREQLETWRRTRPGERILDIDIPLSYGLLDVKIDPQQLSSLEFIWDARREGGIFVKINAISTEFTARRHGGEKGVPFRVQVETYSLHGGDEPPRLLHCASCQVKVFKPKGADRKHKTDREKLEKRSEAEKEKFQPSFECTVMSEIPLDQVKGYLDQLYVYKPNSSDSQAVKEMTPNQPQNSAATKNSLALGLIGQFNSSSQLNIPSLSCSSSSPSNNTIPPALIDLPSAINHSTTASDPSNNVGRNVSGTASNSSISSRELVAGRLDYQSQTSPSFAHQQRAPCISVTVSQGMSFINMSGSRDSLLSQTSRKPLLSPTLPSVPSFQHQMALPPKLENCGQQISVTRSSGCVMTDSSCSIGSLPLTSPTVLSANSSAQQVVQWLTDHRFSNFIQDFQNFSGSDLLRLTRDELTQICGLADGIRLDNALQAKNIRPKLTIYVYQENEYDRLRCGGARSNGRHSSDSHWDMVSPVGSPSCSSPYPSSSQLSSCSSDPSLPTTNLLATHISSSCGAYLERRRGSVQLPTPSSRLPVNFLSAKRRFNRTYDSSTEEDAIDGNSRKKQRLRQLNMSQIDGYCAVYLETYSVCHLADKLAALFHIDVSQIDDMYYKGPSGINVLITDSVVQNLVDQARYAIEITQLGDVSSGLCRMLLKYVD